ncbi:MAG: aromatic amino acid aminotransferase [Phycisphaeraceae bacterium]|nr:aromatic amino acid aminotransferase [Phycisphaeraceae bacterium]
MFESVEMAAPDPILGLTEAFLKDANPKKINLGVGVYKSNEGVTPILDCVKQAETKLIATEKTKGYKPIDGDPAYGKAVLELMFGADHEVVTSGRAATAHCPGGTGSLRVAGEYLANNHAGATIWVSDPTWANHGNVFAAAGLPTKTYPYFDATTNGLNFDAMLEALKQIPAGDVVLLHGCCHNPTGVDPSTEQWEQIGEVLAANGVTVLLDFAYQGFGLGLEEDAQGLLALAKPGREMIICSSFSKNFGLYNERTGALTFVGKDADTTAKVMSQAKKLIRANYSNPPAHGGAIVSTILADAELTTLWKKELADMRDRINGMRELFVETLKAKGVTRDFEFIKQQLGMFSFSGLNKDQVNTLKTEHGVYIVRSGRISVAGMTPSNMDYLCESIAAVL